MARRDRATTAVRGMDPATGAATLTVLGSLRRVWMVSGAGPDVARPAETRRGLTMAGFLLLSWPGMAIAGQGQARPYRGRKRRNGPNSGWGHYDECDTVTTTRPGACETRSGDAWRDRTRQGYQHSNRLHRKPWFDHGAADHGVGPGTQTIIIAVARLEHGGALATHGMDTSTQTINAAWYTLGRA